MFKSKWCIDCSCIQHICMVKIIIHIFVLAQKETTRVAVYLDFNEINGDIAYPSLQSEIKVLRPAYSKAEDDCQSKCYSPHDGVRTWILWRNRTQRMTDLLYYKKIQDKKRKEQT